MGAMDEEIRDIRALLDSCTEVEIGRRTFVCGQFNAHEVVLCASRWGKVAAAATASTLIHKFGVTEIHFTGVAGGIAPQLKVGDIVIGQTFIQHDMDARPIFQRFEIPLLGISSIQANEDRVNAAKDAVIHAIETRKLFQNIETSDLEKFHIQTPTVYSGLIASGDRFFSEEKDKKQLLAHLPEILCVEMEGAAVAQVCFEHSIPFTIIRTISDSANEAAVEDFQAFIQKIAGFFSANIIQCILGAAKVRN